MFSENKSVFKGPLVAVCVYNRTVVYDTLQALVNALFMHMGFIVKPLWIFTIHLSTSPDHYILLRRVWQDPLRALVNKLIVYKGDMEDLYKLMM